MMRRGPIRLLRVVLLLVLAVAAVPDESRVHAQTVRERDLRFSAGDDALPVRATGVDSPILSRGGPVNAILQSAGVYRVPNTGTISLANLPTVTSLYVNFWTSGNWVLHPTPVPNPAQRGQFQSGVALIVTRLNAAGDALAATSQDTFLLEPAGSLWNPANFWTTGVGADGAGTGYGTRVASAFSSGSLSSWHVIAVDKTYTGVVLDEANQRFVLQEMIPAPPAPPEEPEEPEPAAPSRVTGVRVSALDGGLRVSWSPAAGEVSQYRVDAADASGKLARRVYTDATVFEALVDRLANGVEYTVTVTALTSEPGVEGPGSEPRTMTPRAGAGDTGETPDPVPALPLAGAGVLAGLLYGAARRLRRARLSSNGAGRR